MGKGGGGGGGGGKGGEVFQMFCLSKMLKSQQTKPNQTKQTKPCPPTYTPSTLARGGKYTFSFRESVGGATKSKTRPWANPLRSRECWAPQPTRQSSDDRPGSTVLQNRLEDTALISKRAGHSRTLKNSSRACLSKIPECRNAGSGTTKCPSKSDTTMGRACRKRARCCNSKCHGS